MKEEKLRERAEKFVAPFRIEDGRKFRLKDFDPGDTRGLESKGGRAKEILREGIALLADYQDRLYAQDRWAVLLIFQAMDAAGKDSAIEHVMSGVNPQGVGLFVQGALARGSRSRLSVALPPGFPNAAGSGSSTVRSTEEGRWWCGSTRRSSAARRSRSGGRREYLEGSLRGHPEQSERYLYRNGASSGRSSFTSPRAAEASGSSRGLRPGGGTGSSLCRRARSAITGTTTWRPTRT